MLPRSSIFGTSESAIQYTEDGTLYPAFSNWVFLGGGRLFGSHKSEGSFLNFWNVCSMDYELCNWVCGKIAVRALDTVGRRGLFL